MKKVLILSLISFISLIFSCRIDKKIEPENSYNPTPYTLSLPKYINYPAIPLNNPLTIEGIELGRKLFYDPILSKDETQSCASCHNLDYGFTDNNNQFSKGVDKIEGNRNSMPIFNLAWSKNFFWDSREKTLEDQATQPIINPIEMHETIDSVLIKLNKHAEYPDLFYKAFGSNIITKENLSKAISQFERSVISFNSEFDKINNKQNLFALYNSHYSKILRDTNYFHTIPSSFERGMMIFYSNDFRFSGHCSHCHGATPKDLLFTNFEIRNNGLFSSDSGYASITKNSLDLNKFKTPSLRNLRFSAPYMHDGRMKTLNEVIEHYSSGVPNLIDATTKNDFKNPLPLTQSDKNDLIEFLNALNDSSFILNQNYKKP